MSVSAHLHRHWLSGSRMSPACMQGMVSGLNRLFGRQLAAERRLGVGHCHKLPDLRCISVSAVIMLALRTPHAPAAHMTHNVNDGLSRLSDYFGSL